MPSCRDLPNLEIKLGSPALQADFLPAEPPGNSYMVFGSYLYYFFFIQHLQYFGLACLESYQQPFKGHCFLISILLTGLSSQNSKTRSSVLPIVHHDQALGNYLIFIKLMTLFLTNLSCSELRMGAARFSISRMHESITRILLSYSQGIWITQFIGLLLK